MMWRYLAIFLVGAWVSVEGASLSVPVGQFAFEGKGAFSMQPDRRDFFQINHPWQVSEPSAFGRMTAEVTIPADMEPPYWLHFYSTDNNSDKHRNFRVNPKGSTAFVDYKPDHRFKQVKVGGQVVWRSDIFADSGEGARGVDITSNVRPGEPFRLEAEILDEVPSTERLPGDRAEFSDTRANFNKPEKYQRFETRSYWGDFVIDGSPTAPETSVTATAVRPTREFLAEGNAGFFDLKAGLPMAVEKRELLVSGRAWPVQMGFPFAKGALREVEHLRLIDEVGKAVPAQFSVMNRWPDGSIRWAGGVFSLHQDRGATLVLKEANDLTFELPDPVVSSDWSIATAGANLSVKLADGRPVEIVLSRNGKFVARLLGGEAGVSFVSGGKDFIFEGESVRWLTQNAFMAELEIEGSLLAGRQRLGQIRLRAAMFAGCPDVRLLITMVNERSVDTDATRYTWDISVEDPMEHGRGSDWMAVGDLTVAIKDFSQLGPNALAVEKGGVALHLYQSDADPLVMHPGEAKTHEIWLEAGSDAARAAQLSLCVNTPPRLRSAELVRESMVWGEMPDVRDDSHPEVIALLKEKIGPFFRSTAPGFRSYGSLSLEDTNYANFYWNTLHTLYTLYAMTGEREWYDLAERSVRQYMDAVICHWSRDSSEVGGAHGYEGPKEGPLRQDYSNRPFMIRLQYPHPCFDHWNMTLDPRGYQSGVAIANFTFGNKEMRKAARIQSARHQGWNLMDMVRAWQETGEAKYLANAGELTEVAESYMDLRRGTYLSFHGNMSQPGAQPFMDGILGVGLRRYYQVSEQPEVFQVLSRVTDSIYAEAGVSLEKEGRRVIQYHYSPDPFQRGTDGTKTISQLNPTYTGNQAYLACMLQDRGLAEVALGTWRAYLGGDHVNAAQYCFDLPAAIYWTDRARPLVRGE